MQLSSDASRNIGRAPRGGVHRTIARVADIIIKRFGFITAGVFILALVLVILASSTPTNAKPASINSSPAGTTLETTTTGSTNSNQSLNTAPTGSSTSSSETTDVSSSSNNGQQSTNVTINGQHVDVPSDGTTDTTVGDSNVKITHTGGSSNNFDNSTSINVESNSSTSTGGN